MKDIQERSFEFAIRIVQLHEFLTSKRGAPRFIARQVLRSGTSVGANLEEASAAQSKPDFISKCSIASKEARETRYWLRVLTTCKSIPASRLAPLVQEAGEIVAILMTIVRNAQSSDSRSPDAPLDSPPFSTFNIQH